MKVLMRFLLDFKYFNPSGINPEQQLSQIQVMQSEKDKQIKPIILTVDQIRSKWDEISSIYCPLDPCMQGFYVTLIHMLRLDQAKHILEVACGTGRFLTTALSLKPIQSSYLATDLCPNMIEQAKANLKTHINKLGVTKNFQDWLAKHHLSFGVQNGEYPIDSPLKFDRIICNLVLHITEDPYKMLTNLNSSAEKGCLLGLSIVTNQLPGQNNMIPLGDRVMEDLNRPPKRVRSFFHLQNKIADLAQKTGWQLVVEWKQNAPFGQCAVTEELKNFAKELIAPDEEILNQVMKRIQKLYDTKKVLNFTTKMAIFRKN